jgi:hypothetical protein
MLGCLAILAAPVIALPAHAESSDSSPPYPTGDRHSGTTQAAWHEDHQEMSELRTEREQLESERDTLKVLCMDAKGQDRSSCQKKSDELHQREAALHEKMESEHGKMSNEHEKHEAWRKEHHGEWKAKRDMKNKPPMGSNGKSTGKPSGTPPASSTPSSSD